MENEYPVYEGFAAVYDLFMDNIPYDEWHDYLTGLLKKYDVSDGIVVDLACGTGEMTYRLCQDGYDMIGVDISEEMLEIAREKCSEKILFLRQDMRELDLYGSVSAMVCICDGMNYICESEGLSQVFKRVATFLDEGGIFIFDMKTDYFYREIVGDRTIAENRENASFIWENEYDPETGINEYLLTVYELVDDDNDLFVRTDELHRQRAYSVEKVKKLAAANGLVCSEILEAFTDKVPGEEAERIYFIMTKKINRNGELTWD